MKCRTTAILAIVVNFAANALFAQSTAYTYQGQLQNNGSPVSGTYNFTFSLFDSNIGGLETAGPVTNSGVIVNNGLFMVLIDFGPEAFIGATNWLEISVATNGVDTFATLTPRQHLTPTPYAIMANQALSAVTITGAVPNARLEGSYTMPVTLNNSSNVFSGFFDGNGSGLTNLNATSLTFNFGNGNSGSGLNLFLDQAGDSYQTGTGNTGMAYGALAKLQTGIWNTAIGPYALLEDTTGSFNTAIGYQTLYSNSVGFENTALGVEPLYFNTVGSQNTAIGYFTLQGTPNSAGIGSNNTATGCYAMYDIISGCSNVADGSFALKSITSGNANAANGVEAMYRNTTGSNNTASGFATLVANTTGSLNTIVGFQAGQNILTGTNNAYFGANVQGPGDENNTTRIGTVQTVAYVAGIVTASNGFASYASNLTRPTTINVGISPFTYTNTSGQDTEVFIGGGVVTSFAVNGAVVATNLSLSGLTTVFLENNETLRATYKKAPTMTFLTR
jgi:hypothetical protein